MFNNETLDTEQRKLHILRRLILTVFFTGLFGAIAAKLLVFGFTGNTGHPKTFRTTHLETMRPDLRDRNGEILATDIETFSYYAEPRRIIDPDEAAEKITSVFKEIDPIKLRKKLAGNAGFTWIKRKLTSQQKHRIQSLGIPGTGFIPEVRRFYPGTSSASHLVGHVNIDNKGIAGIEKFIEDDRLKYLRASGLLDESDLVPVTLSVDLRVQHAVRTILIDAIERYSAKAAAGAIMDVQTGELYALVSLPDYDPNEPVDALKQDRINRITSGAFELGSVMKTITLAMALESGRVSLENTFDATHPFVVNGQKIKDFYPQGRILSMPEVFIHSSNIGATKIALQMTPQEHEAFLKSLFLLSKPQLELPERALPIRPKQWNALTSATVSYGYGLSVTPIQFLAASAAIINGGNYVQPTLFKRSRAQAKKFTTPVISEQVSLKMRYLLRLNAEIGSGRKANVKGYSIGGKTGTAEKVVNGRYDEDLKRASFFSAFPIHAPRFAMIVILDEPEKEHTSANPATASNNAAPTTARIIERVAPMLGLLPEKTDIKASMILNNNLAGLLQR